MNNAYTYRVMPDPDVVILVPLSEEFRTVRDVFSVTETWTRNKITFYTLEAGTDSTVVGVVLNRMGNPAAAQQTERILQTLGPDGPQLVVVLGIAGRLDDDLRIGDVVIAEQVTNYEVRSKISENTGEQASGDHNDTSQAGLDGIPLVDWRPGGVTHHAADEVIEAAAYFQNGLPEAYQTWREQTVDHFESKIQTDTAESRRKIADRLASPPRIQTSPIASGGLVVASRSFSRHLAEQNRNFAAVEMEAAGVMEAVKRTNGVRGMVIRGISDFADTQKDKFEAMREVPCRHCATYAAASYLREFFAQDLVQRAVPLARPESHPTALSDQHSITTERLSVEDIEISPIGGPGTSYIREHSINDLQSSLGSPTEPRGRTVSLHFEVNVPQTAALRTVRLVANSFEKGSVARKRVIVGDRVTEIKPEKKTALVTPHLLPANEGVEIRIEKLYKIEATSTAISARETEPDEVEIELGLISESSETDVQLLISGQVTDQEGLIPLDVELEES